MNARTAVVLVFVVAVAAILFFTFGRGGPDPAGSAGGGPSGSKAEPTANATQITMLYSTEKKDWIEAAAVGAIRVGCDQLLVCKSRPLQEQARDALVRGVERGELSMARLREAASRVEALKRAYTSPFERANEVRVALAQLADAPVM